MLYIDIIKQMKTKRKGYLFIERYTGCVWSFVFFVERGRSVMNGYFQKCGDSEFNYRNYILVSGDAVVAKESIVSSTREYMRVSFLIDKKTHCVVDAVFNVLCEMHNDYLRKIALGFCMDDPINDLLQEIKDHVYIGSSGAVLQAIRNLAERYKKHV